MIIDCSQLSVEIVPVLKTDFRVVARCIDYCEVEVNWIYIIYGHTLVGRRNIRVGDDQAFFAVD